MSAGYRAGVSTGAGPFTLYHGIGATKRRRPRSTSGSTARRSGPSRATVVAYQRQAAAAAKSNEANQIAAAVQALTDLHRHPVEPVTPPAAPEPPPVDETAIRRRHLSEATKGIGFWHRADRKAAAQQAATAADAKVAATRAKQQAQRQQMQAQLDERWRELLHNQPDVVLATLAEAFEDNQAHASPVSVDGAEASIVVVVPGPRSSPNGSPRPPRRGTCH